MVGDMGTAVDTTPRITPATLSPFTTTIPAIVMDIAGLIIVTRADTCIATGTTAIAAPALITATSGTGETRVELNSGPL